MHGASSVSCAAGIGPAAAVTGDQRGKFGSGLAIGGVLCQEEALECLSRDSYVLFSNFWGSHEQNNLQRKGGACASLLPKTIRKAMEPYGELAESVTKAL